MKSIAFALILLLLIISKGLVAQEKHPIECNVSKENLEVNKNFLKDYKKSRTDSSLINRNSSTNVVCLPMILHVIRDDNGTDFLDPIDIPRFMSTLNYFMLDIGAKFHLVEIRYMDSDFYSNASNTPNFNVFNQFNDPNATNLYLRDSPGNSGGSIDAIKLHLSYTGFRARYQEINQTILHEFGHYFGLLHTFTYTDNGNTHSLAENVARTGVQANCDTNGDGFCDTPADNYFSPDDTDIHGVPYEPDVTNFMSYFGTKTRFSNEQILAMQAGLVAKLNHTDYNFTGYVQNNPPQAPVLTASFAGYSNELTWTDVDDLGYVVERSEVSATTGFRPFKLGGVRKDETVFNDTQVESNKDYWYRVIPVNSCDAYSNVIQVTTGEILGCVPNQLNNCNELLDLSPDAVVLHENSVTLFNDNQIGCYDHPEVVDNSQVTLQSNVDYTIDFTMSNYNSVYLNFFMDVNRDGDFDDVGEWIVENELRTYSQDYSTTFSIPTELTEDGITGMRVIVNQYSTGSTGISSPCDLPNQLVFVRDYLVSIEKSKVIVSPKVMLQGAAFNPNVGEEMLMRDDLRLNSYIPATSPYSDMQTCDASVFTTTGADAIVDWVYVELRDPSDSAVIIEGTSALLQRDGDVVDADGSSPVTLNQPDGDYHVVVKHRNHLGIMTASIVTLSSSTTTVDFTDAANQITYGSHAQTTSGMPTNVLAMWAGNVNDDTIVQYTGTHPDSPDILSLVLNDPGNFLNLPTYVVTGYHSEDVNMDGNTQYTGTNPDTPFILQNVLAHPGNFFNFSTYQIMEQLPEN